MTLSFIDEKDSSVEAGGEQTCVHIMLYGLLLSVTLSCNLRRSSCIRSLRPSKVAISGGRSRNNGCEFAFGFRFTRRNCRRYYQRPRGDNLVLCTRPMKHARRGLVSMNAPDGFENPFFFLLVTLQLFTVTWSRRRSIHPCSSANSFRHLHNISLQQYLSIGREGACMVYSSSTLRCCSTNQSIRSLDWTTPVPLLWEELEDKM